MVLPFKILVSPLKTFNQFAQKPTAKGLILVLALILVVAAATLYAFATKVVLQVNSEPTSFLAAGIFSDWFLGYFASTAFGIILYWLIFATGLALISRVLGGKEISIRVLFLGLAYLLSVFVILYAVRTVIYLALPTLYFSGLSHWPPADEMEVNSALNVINAGWGVLPSQIDFALAFASLIWLAVLGAVAVKVLREVSWSKAAAVSLVVIIFTFLLLRLP